MTIVTRVLGAPGRDNALLVTVNGGQRVARLLFDCGAGCVAELAAGEALAVEHLLFSHLHMDHVGGFDDLFRLTFARAAPANHIWGPPGTGAIMQHRFRGFLWNLHAGLQGSWRVHHILPDRVETRRYELAEAFAEEHREPDSERAALPSAPEYRVEALAMDHHTTSLAYIVREPPRRNVDPARLEALGLAPGPWLAAVKDSAPPGGRTVTVAGQERSVAELRAALITKTPGSSAAYLTDFLLDGAAADRLAPALQGVGTMVCEAQYAEADEALARQHRHMTAAAAARLARRAGVGRLVLFHLSERYHADGWRALLAEAQAIFPATSFPEQWGELGM